MNYKAQVWVETVIYTLIAFALIGVVLGFARPKIEEFQDKSVIDQTVKVLEDINNIIYLLVQGGEGNKRVPQFTIKEGTLTIDAESNKIIFEIDSKYVFTEIGEDVQIEDRISANTEKKGKSNIVTLTMDYGDSYNLTYKGEDISQIITKSSTPYKLAISNKGTQEDGKTKINFELV